MSDIRDVFICHASADKEEVVYPLVKLLEAGGVSCWLDEAEIAWGDSVTQKVNDGLRTSRLVIVVLSPNFARHWPQRELYSALELEASSGAVRVLPLLTGPAQHRSEVIDRYPLLRDKLYLLWPGGQERIVPEIRRRLGADRDPGQPAPPPVPKRFDIPIPQVRTEPSQLDRDRFAQEGFETVKAYFADALQELRAANPAVQTDFLEVHARKFVAKAYAGGDLKAQCKIWLGGPFNDVQISYSADARDVDRDNAYNDWLSLKAGSLAWEPSMPPYGSERGPFDHEGAAAYLWERFIEGLR